MNKYGELLENINFYELISLAEKVYGPYSRPDGRAIVIIVNDDGSRRTVSYPKYLMEQHLGKVLDKDEHTIDHINRDHNDNDINNLRIVPRAQHSKDDTRRVKLVEFDCAMCNAKFERSPRLVRDKSKKGRGGPFCGRACAGRYARKVQLGLMEKLPAQPFTESEYYRNIKNLENAESMTEYFIKKYASNI